MIPVRALRERITLTLRTFPGGGSGSGSGDGGTDRYGNPIAVESQVANVPAAMQPMKLGTEVMDEGDRRENRYRLITGPDVNLDGLAAVTWRGREFEVHGEPQLFTDRNGPHHFEVVVLEVQGA